MKTNYVNIDHVHALISMPTNKTIEEVFQLLKGNSSYWINLQIENKFQWAKGYAAFSVSDQNLGKVVKYINNQELHHKRESFSEEFDELMQKSSKVNLSRSDNQV